jgi:dynein assembly factor 6, axonemal
MTSFTTAEVETLTSMLDKNFAYQRPESQLVGYSLAEAPNGAAQVVPTAEGTAPGGVHIPATIVNKTIGLPAPSLSKEADAMRRADELALKPKKPKGNAIWAPEEVSKIGSRGAPAKLQAQSSSSASKESEGRIEPEHSVLYKQNLTAEDVYLGADFTRDGSSARSDGVILKVKLPKATTAKDFNLEVEAFAVVLSTPDYYLKAHMPVKVVEKKASAKWDAATKSLQVTLTVDTTDKEVKVV